MSNIIDFNEAYNRISVKQNFKEIKLFMEIASNLAVWKLKSMQVSGEESTVSDSLPFTAKEIEEAIYKANDFLVDNYNPDDVNTVTCLPDELSKIAVEYLLGKKLTTLNDLVPDGKGYR